MAVLWWSASSHKPRPEDQSVLPTPVNAPGPQSPPTPMAPPAGLDQVGFRRPEKLRRRVQRQASEDNPDEAEVVTQFFPLWEGENFTALENVRLVRVELPG